MEKSNFKHPEQIAAYNEAQSPFWFWNDKLDTNELKRQLNLMTEKKVACNAPHARTGFSGEYLDQEWMQHIKTVADYKESHGETMWLYDEFNWPSGIADGSVTKDERLREKYLSVQKFFIPANTRFRIQPVQLRQSGFDAKEAITRAYDGKKKIDNLYVFDAETNERLDVQAFQPDDISGQLFNLSENDFEVFRDRDTILYEARVQTSLFEGEGYYDPDYLNPDSAKRFIEVTFERYYAEFAPMFGNVITAFFDDESRFCHALPWTERLPDLFEQRYGYRLEEHISDLIMPGADAGYTRCDYFDLLADLFRDQHHARLYQWCEAHGIDYCPHYLGEETLAAQVRYTGDLLRQFRFVSRPGVDHLGKGIGSLNIRFASSAAELYGKKGLACEAFAANGWDLTFEEYIRTISWLYSQGIETLTNHAFFYSTEGERKNDWPPSQFFQWQGWLRMEEANKMCRRLYGMMHESWRKTELLIYHPTESFWASYIPDQNFTHGYHMGPFIQGKRAAEIDRNEQILLNRMQEENRDFTVFGTDACDQFRVKDGFLININTNLRYRCIVLPMCDVLPTQAAKMLEEFSEKGGYIAFIDGIPQHSRRKTEDEALRNCLQKILASNRTKCFKGLDTEGLLSWLNKVLPQEFEIISGPKRIKKNSLHYPDWMIDPYIHTGEDISGISWTAFESAESRRYYLVNFTNQEQEVTVCVKGRSQPEVWNTLTGEIAMAEVLGCGEGFVTVKLNLPKDYGVFLEMKLN